MSRFDKVRKETDEFTLGNQMDFGSRYVTNFFMRQISETLAMIYDDGFAEELVIVEKEKEEDDYGYYKCRYSEKHCEYADDLGWCMGNLDCMYKQREKNN